MQPSALQAFTPPARLLPSVPAALAARRRHFIPPDPIMSQRDRADSSASAKNLPPKRDIISRPDWDLRLDDAPLSKDDLNKLVLNYLVIEGYKDAAEHFCAEAALHPQVNLASINDRMLIRTAIQDGNIEDAIERVNDLDPDILESNPSLYFHLQQQRLIELIRQGDVGAALDFAQQELAPRGEENPAFLEELERTMSLLVFGGGSGLGGANESPVADLYDVAQRQKTAREVNAAILLAQSQEKEPKLPMLIKCMQWAQSQLASVAVFPQIEDPASGQFVVPPECEPTDLQAMQL